MFCRTKRVIILLYSDALTCLDYLPFAECKSKTEAEEEEEKRINISAIAKE